MGMNRDLKMKIFVIMVVAIVTTNFSSPSSEGGGLLDTKPQAPIISPTYSFEDLLDAIEQVESNGDPDAVGDNSNAVGSFQIHKIYVDDVNRILDGKRYSYLDRLSPHLSRQMVKMYIWHYATKKCLKQEPTLEDMARIHNGGPNGYKKPCTIKYWIKVKKELAK